MKLQRSAKNYAYVSPAVDATRVVDTQVPVTVLEVQKYVCVTVGRFVRPDCRCR